MVLTTHLRPQLLARALDSLLSQTMNNFEIISINSNDPQFHEANIHFKNKLYI